MPLPPDQAGKYALIFEKKDSRPIISVYADAVSVSQYYAPSYAKIIVHEILADGMSKRFREIDIILHADIEITGRTLHDLKSEDVSHRGFVSQGELRSGANIVHVRFDSIYLGSSRRYPDRDQRMNYLYTQLRGVIIHELTHLWQLRITNMAQVTKRNEDRLKLAFAAMTQNNRLFDRSESIDKIWLALRTNLIEVLDFINVEGIARYYQDVSTGKKDATDESLRVSYAQAYVLADKLNKDLGLAYTRFFAAIAQYDATMAMKGHKGEPEYDRMWNLRVDAYVALRKDITKICEETVKSGYDIGAHIYHMLWNLTGATDEQLASASLPTLIDMYERCCDTFHWQPVVSLRSGKGVFSYANHIAFLTRIRKEAEKKNIP